MRGVSKDGNIVRVAILRDARPRGHAPQDDGSVWYDPGSAAQREDALHRVPDTIHFVSTMRFKLARPTAKSFPIMLSMLMNSCITFDINGAGPCISQLTFVVSP